MLATQITSGVIEVFSQGQARLPFGRRGFLLAFVTVRVVLRPFCVKETRTFSMSTYDEQAQSDGPKEHPKANSDSNSSPETKDSDAHISGTGIGALGGTTLGTAVGGAIGGPVGAAVGAVIGSVAGGAAGNRTAEVLESVEDDNANEEGTAGQDDQ